MKIGKGMEKRRARGKQMNGIIRREGNKTGRG